MIHNVPTSFRQDGMNNPPAFTFAFTFPTTTTTHPHQHRTVRSTHNPKTYPYSQPQGFSSLPPSPHALPISQKPVSIYRLWISTFFSASLHVQEGKEEGKEEGKKGGREEGRKEGREEERKEGMHRTLVAWTKILTSDSIWLGDCITAYFSRAAVIVALGISVGLKIRKHQKIWHLVPSPSKQFH